MQDLTHILARQLQEAKKRMDLIHTVTSELNKIIPLPEKLDNILNILFEQFGIRYSMILLPDAAGETLVVKSDYGYQNKILGAEVALGVGIAGLAALNKKTINITGIRRKKKYLRITSMQQDEPKVMLPGIADPESQIAIPLISNNKLVAVLMAESENLSVFNKEDELFLITLSQSVAVSIQNSVVFDNMEALIAKRTAELEKSNNTKDRLFSVISHDLRGPLASFLSLSKLIQHYSQANNTEKLQLLTVRIHQSVQKLNTLLDNLLGWAMTQTRELKPRAEKVNLLPVLNEVIEIFNENMAAKELRLHLSVDAVSTLGDSNMLSAVFRNIVSNAIKYTPREGEIFITAYAENTDVVVTIQDTGVGIAAEKLAMILEPAEGKTTQGTENERGTGLGLLVAKEFVQLNNGTISIDSGSGGTIVTVSFPRFPA